MSSTITATETTPVKTPAWAKKLGLDFNAYEAKLITVTPEIAEQLLSLNTKNRTLKTPAVDVIVRQIEKGKFNGRTSSSIGISCDGKLTDGQHRLNAIVKTRVTLLLIVVTGCDPMAVLAPNSRPRTLAEFLKVHEFSYASVLAPMVKFLYLVDGPDAYTEDGEFKPNWRYGINQSHLTDEELLEYLNANPVFADYAKLGSSLHNRIDRAVPAKFLGGFSYFVDTHLENGKADREFFFDRLADGVGLDADSPILALRNYLHARKFDNTEKAASLVGKFIKAWNAYRQDEKVARGKLVFRVGGANPEKMPAVI